MLKSKLRRTVLIVTIGLLAVMLVQPVVAEEFDIVFLAKPSAKHKQPATIALVGGGYTNGLAKGMTGISYQVFDVGGTGFPALEMNDVMVQDVTAFASSCLIQGVRLEEITSDCVVSFDLPTLTAQDFRLLASEAMAVEDYERAVAYLEKLVRTDSLSPDSSAYQLLDTCRAKTSSEFSRELSRKERKLENKRAPVYHKLGAFFFNNDDYDAARYYLERTIRGDNKREHAKRLLCIIEDGVPCNLPDTGVEITIEVFPEMIKAATPTYPRVAKQAGITGMVWVKSLVDEDGSVVSACTAKSSGSLVLDLAAVESAYDCKFKPGIQNGKPVPCWVIYKVDFVLDR